MKAKLVVSLAVALTVALLAGRAAWAADVLPQVPEAELTKVKAALPAKAAAEPAKPRRILIFCRTEGFPHDSIPIGAKALELMGEKTGAWKSDASVDMSAFDADSLKKYDAVVFNNTTQLKFKEQKHREALLEFVRNGGGMVGIHSACDNFPTWKEGQELIGGLFAGHPWHHIPVKVDDPASPLAKPFDGKGFWINDEIYKFKEPYSRDRLRVLLSMDMSRMKDKGQSRPDGDNAVAWIQEVDKGHVFYCSLGHEHAVFWNPTLLQFYCNGVQYALGDLKADATPSAKLSPQPQPAHAPEKEEK
jgi:type 1 glutamine amidotransferase